MKFALAVLIAALWTPACTVESPGDGAAGQTAAPPAASVAPPAPVPSGSIKTPAPSSHGRVIVDGTVFAHADGTRFHWRGITAFRLAEQIAHGHEADAVAYLDWARDNGITVVRVLAMARHLFELSPTEGLEALPRLLTLAAERGLYVEVVALADTAEYELDLDAHVTAAGKIAATHPNAFLEIANEPFHRTQASALHDRATLVRLAALVPDDVVLAYGSERTVEETLAGDDAVADPAARADYVTVHTPRGGDPWNHVRALAVGATLVAKFGRPVVSDEPIGAAPQAVTNRRDNSAERFRAAALLTRMTGMHATFHYEGGLQAQIPDGPELAAFNAWREAWDLLPHDIERGTFRRLETPTGAAFETRLSDVAWTLTLEGAPAPAGASPIERWSGSALWRR